MIQQAFVARQLGEQNSYQRTLHFHDSNEILFTLNDNCSFFLDGQLFDISRGALILIPEGAIHRKINPPTVVPMSYSLHYPISLLDAYSTPFTDLIQTFGSTSACIQLPNDAIKPVTAMFQSCILPTEETFGSDIRRNMTLLNLLLDLYPLLSADSGEGTVHSNTSPLISELIEYINAHLTERLTLDDLSNLFFISKYNLCRQFKKETGFTIIEYINSSRIRMACSLLRKEKAITDIGSRVGFPNASHFIHTFRQNTGMTPRAYLKRYQEFTNVPVFYNFSPHDSE